MPYFQAKINQNINGRKGAYSFYRNEHIVNSPKHNEMTRVKQNTLPTFLRHQNQTSRYQMQHIFTCRSSSNSCNSLHSTHSCNILERGTDGEDGERGTGDAVKENQAKFSHTTETVAIWFLEKPMVWKPGNHRCACLHRLPASRTLSSRTTINSKRLRSRPRPRDDVGR